MCVLHTYFMEARQAAVPLRKIVKYLCALNSKRTRGDTLVRSERLDVWLHTHWKKIVLVKSYSAFGRQRSINELCD